MLVRKQTHDCWFPGTSYWTYWPFVGGTFSLRPHSTRGLSATHSAKGQTGNLSVTHDPAVTQWPQIHQGSVTWEFTEVICCSKKRRLLFLEGRLCYLIKERKDSKIIIIIMMMMIIFSKTLGGVTCWDVSLTNISELSSCGENEWNDETETGTRGREALRLHKQKRRHKGNHGRLWMTPCLIVQQPSVTCSA